MYNQPTPTEGLFFADYSSGDGSSVEIAEVSITGVPFGDQYYNGSGGPSGKCSGGEVLHVDGQCVDLAITSKVYLYDSPDVPEGPIGPPPSVPPPKVDHSILLVNIPGEGPAPEPIIIPRQAERASCMLLINTKKSLSK